MAKRENADREDSSSGINAVLTDDVLLVVFSKLESKKERDAFGLVCKRWLRFQNTERRRLRATTGPAMLRQMANRFSGIVELDMSQSAIGSFFPWVTDSDLSVVAASFPLLRVLNLRNCKGITDAGMIPVGNGLPCLHSLDVSNCEKLTDKGLVPIANGCHNLLRLWLVGCKAITDELLLVLSHNCHRLEELELAGFSKITDIGIMGLADGCRQIKCLDVSKCRKVGDAGICSIAETCFSSLKVLKLLDCFNVGERSIISLANSCYNLETLVISRCCLISDDSIRSLALSRCCESLRILRMKWCDNITDLTLSLIFSKCRHLMDLDIGYCEEITDLGFEGLKLGDLVSEMKVLNVRNLPRITVVAVGIILQFCKSLIYLNLRSCQHVSRRVCEEAGLQIPEFFKINFV